MTTTRYAAGLGFAFVAAWIAFGFGNAILCLIGAAISAVAAAYCHGELDVAEMQDRFGQAASHVRPRAGRRAG